jgi:hypothetical protein
MSARMRWQHAITRCTLGLLGLAAFVWSFSVVPNLAKEEWLVQTAEAIKRGEEISSRATSTAASPAGFVKTRPSTLSQIVVISVFSFETAVASGQSGRIEQSRAMLQSFVARSLDSAPTDPFLWLVVYWLSNITAEEQKSRFEYLRMSYSLGPNEGWIAEKRNPLAFKFRDQLPIDVADNAILEFVGLVNSSLYSEPVQIMSVSDAPARGALYAYLRNLSDAQRRGFAEALRQAGIEEPVSPKELVPERPWQ